jgi:hypothetical protein
MSALTKNCVTKFCSQFIRAVTINLISRKLWLVILALWWSWADLWAMTVCLPTLTSPEQVNGFVELGKQHRLLVAAIVLGYLTANSVTKKTEDQTT